MVLSMPTPVQNGSQSRSISKAGQGQVPMDVRPSASEEFRSLTFRIWALAPTGPIEM